MALSRARQAMRKEDTRRKIELGGLVIKAGLDQEDKAVLLGMLIDAFEQLQGEAGNRLRAQWKRAGTDAFGTQEAG